MIRRGRTWLAVAAAGCAGAMLAACGDGQPSSDDLDATEVHGQELVAAHGCISCHSADGTDRVGPSFAGQWGTERRLSDGSVVVFDAEHVETNLADPQARVREDYGARMPAFDDLSDEEVEAITAYLRALGE